VHPIIIDGWSNQLKKISLMGVEYRDEQPYLDQRKKAEEKVMQ